MAAPKSYLDPHYDELDSKVEQRLGLPSGLQKSIRINGEKTNADRVSSAGARTVYQITPTTRKLVLEKYGIDPYLNTSNAALASGYLLKESLDRNNGDPAAATVEYHGGTNPANHGPITAAYKGRVIGGMEDIQISDAINSFRQQSTPQNEQPQQETGSSPEEQAQLDDIEKSFKASQTKPEEEKHPFKDPFTGEDRQTHETDILPSITELPELQKLTPEGFKVAVGSLFSGPKETMKMIQSNFPDVEVKQDSKGNYMARSAETGQWFIVHPGFEKSDIPRAAAQIMAYTPAGRASTVLGSAAAMGGTQAAIEGVEKLAGGNFDAGDIATAAAIGGVIPIAGNAVKKAASAIPGTAQKIVDATRWGPNGAAREAEGSMGTAGAQGVGREAQVRKLGEDFPIPMDKNSQLMYSQVTRKGKDIRPASAAEKNIEFGGPLVQRKYNQTDWLNKNVDAFIEQTGAEAGNVVDAGTQIGKRINQLYKREKTKTNILYKKADASAEAMQPVTLTNLVDYVNKNMSSSESADVLKTAYKNLLDRYKQAAVENPATGELIAQPIPVKISEEIRRVIGTASEGSATNRKFGTEMKALIDKDVGDIGGTPYKLAREQRVKVGKLFENQPIINKLLENPKDNAVRKIALEDIFNHVVLKGSAAELQHAKDLLTLGGKSSKTWREVEGQAMKHIQWILNKSGGLGEKGINEVTAKGIDDFITAFDKNGKLDILFEPRIAEQLRDLKHLVQLIKTYPRDTVNSSGTGAEIAMTIDMIISALTGGLVPAATLTRFGVKAFRNKKVRETVARELRGK